jgi:class 3 adenylate cyclase/predicted ATPase
MNQLHQWLQNNGLEKYHSVFDEQAIDMDVLPELSDEDLRELGLPLGDRRRLLKAIASAATTPPVAAQTKLFDAERRQLTVMFCDLVGSTALSSRLDPEKMRDLLRAYQDTCMHAVAAYGGTIARAYGDGLLIYFGYPLAHDDEAARAILAGFDIIEALGRLESGSNTLRVRIGIHTGRVVVGGIRPDDQLDPMGITGDAPNIAARLQEKASPDEIVVSRLVRGLAGKVANFESLGEHTLKGLPDVFTLYRTTASDGIADSKSESNPVLELGMIGRERELAQLTNGWHQFKQGEGRAALITGPPGIGKSQLLWSLTREVMGEGRRPIKLSCSSLRVQSPFLPIAELLKRELKIASRDPAAERLEKLEMLLDRAGVDRDEGMPLLAPVLSISAIDNYPGVDMPADRRAQETIRIIASCLAALADGGEPLLLVEDLHWIDSSTMAVIRYFVEAYAEQPMFVVGTARTEFISPWDGSPGVETIALGQLDDAGTRQLIGSITGADTLDEEIIKHIVTTTDGVPLFVEELTKSVIEAQSLGELPADLTTERLALTSIPASLQDSLLARLDRLGDAKRIAQLGAIIGREFNYQLLASITDLDGFSLRLLIEQLKASGLVFSKAEGSNERFVFKHAMVQGAAYSTLLHSDLLVYHKRIAHAVAREAQQSGVPQPQLLAHHFTEAGELLTAVPYWLEAGEHAAERHAIPETISQLNTGLDLISRLDDTPERAELELKFHHAIAMPIASAKGYTAPELRVTLDRARDLCKKLGSPKQLFPALHGMVKFYQAQADHIRTESLGMELLTIAQNSGDASLLVEAHRNLGMSYAMSGNFLQAVEHCDAALALYEPERHRSHAQLYAVDPSVVAGSFSAFSNWILGNYDKATQLTTRAIAYARDIEHPYSLAFALSNASTVSVFRGEVQETFSTARESLEISQLHGFPYWVGWSAVPLGWALCKMGKYDEGLATMELGLAGYKAAGVLAGRPMRQCLHADALLMADGGESSRALEMIAGVLKLPELQQDMYHSEVYRMQGDLLRDSCPAQHELARASYEKALEVARDQQATAFEQRILESVAGLGPAG